MPYLTRDQIESIGERVYRAYRKLPEIQGKPIYKIDIELLATAVLGLNVEYHKLSRDGSILGLTTFDNVEVSVFSKDGLRYYVPLDGKTVLIEESLRSVNANVGRYHFTLAHESSHQIYNMLFPQAYATEVRHRKVYFSLASDIPMERDCPDWEEWRTDVLASVILMPEDLVSKNLFLFGLDQCPGCIDQIRHHVYYCRFCDMARCMGVSKTALAIRLKQLNMLKVDFQTTRNDILDIFPDLSEQHDMFVGGTS